MLKKIILKIRDLLIVASIPGSIYLVFFLMRPERFGSADSMFLLLQQSIIPTMSSLGLLFILYMGLFDFSIGAILVLSSLVGLTLSYFVGYPGYILGCILTAIFFEAINATLYTLLKVPSLIVTVGTMMIFETVGTYVSKTDVQLPRVYSAFGRFPANIILGFIAIVIAYIILDRTRFGVYVKAIGRSEIMAKNMGVNPVKIKFYGFLVCGFFVGLGAIVLSSYIGAMVPKLGMTSLMRVFVPVIGCFIGITLRKFINVVIGTLVGQFTLNMITMGLIMLRVDAAIQNFIVGLMLIIIIAIMSFRKTEVVK
jgi:ribose transport system permease protein